MERIEWLAWRRAGIGASDAPTIMGVSPWGTPYKLWCDKTGLTPLVDSNSWATDRGNELEPMARADYELMHGLDMPVVLAAHAEYPFLRASLDGYNAEHKIILEIKCPGAADHASAAGGKVPDKYFPQLQHQLLVTGAAKAHYYSFDGRKAHLVEVLPDHSYIQGLLKKELAFWQCVTDKTPPPFAKDDFKFTRFVGSAKYCRAHNIAKILVNLPAVGRFRVNDLYFIDHQLVRGPDE